jgi:hypothetical protein
MMRHILVLVAGAGFAAGPFFPSAAGAQEQTVPPGPPPVEAAPPAASQQSPGAPPANVGAPRSGQPSSLRERITATRQQCQQEAIAQGLTGPAARQQIDSCFAAKMPDVAQRIACGREALSKGIDQAGIRAYVLQCLASKGSSAALPPQPGSATPPTPSAPGTSVAPESSGPVSRQERFNQVHQACTDAAKAKGLTGYDFDRSVRVCFLTSPEVAARERECRQESGARGMVGRDVLPFIRRCMTD